MPVPVTGRSGDGQCYRECAAVVKFRCDRHGSTEPSHQCRDMGKSYSLSRLVLGTGAAEEVKDPLVVLGIDTTAVVGDFEDRETQLCPGPDRDAAGNSRF